MAKKRKKQHIDEHIGDVKETWEKGLFNTDTYQSKEAVEGNNFIKRLALSINVVGVTLQNNRDNTPISTQDKKLLPTFDQFSHGNRLLFTFAKGKEGRKQLSYFVTWLMTGTPQDSWKKVLKDKKIWKEHCFKRRLFCSHTTVHSDNGEVIEEKKGVEWTPFAMFSDMLFGGNLAIGGEGNTHSITGETISANAGEYGHRLISIYCPKGKNKRPVVMVGVENSEPGKQGAYAAVDHGLKAQTNELGAVGGALKFDALRNVPGAENYHIPKLGEARIVINQDYLEKIVSKSADDFTKDMLASTPPLRQALKAEKSQYTQIRLEKIASYEKVSEAVVKQWVPKQSLEAKPLQKGLAPAQKINKSHTYTDTSLLQGRKIERSYSMSSQSTHKTTTMWVPKNKAHGHHPLTVSPSYDSVSATYVWQKRDEISDTPGPKPITRSRSEQGAHRQWLEKAKQDPSDAVMKKGRQEVLSSQHSRVLNRQESLGSIVRI